MSKLTPYAASAFAAASREPARAILNAGLSADRSALADACRGILEAPTAISDLGDTDVLALRGGKYVWAWDDDGVFGIVGDPLPVELGPQLRMRIPDRLHVHVFQSVARFVALVGRYRAAITHLIVSSGKPLDLDTPPPGLLALSGGLNLRAWLQRPEKLRDLEALTLADDPIPWEAVESLPAIRTLGLRLSGQTAEAVLKRIPDSLLARLEVLDIRCSAPEFDFPYGALVAMRARFERLSRLVIGTRSVSDGARRSVEDWPDVVLTDYRRLEVMADDLRTIGFPGGHR